MYCVQRAGRDRSDRSVATSTTRSSSARAAAPSAPAAFLTQLLLGLYEKLEFLVAHDISQLGTDLLGALLHILTHGPHGLSVGALATGEQILHQLTALGVLSVENCVDSGALLLIEFKGIEQCSAGLGHSPQALLGGYAPLTTAPTTPSATAAAAPILCSTSTTALMERTAVTASGRRMVKGLPRSCSDLRQRSQDLAPLR